MRIGLYGVSRSGKNFLINELKKEVPILTVNGSEMLSEISGVAVKDFKNLKSDKKESLREELVENLEKMFPRSANQDVIIDGHYSFMIDDGYDVVMTKKDLSFYDVFIYLDTDSNEIIKRMNESQGFRKNTSVSASDIEKWKEFEKRGLKELCQSAGKDLIILNDNLDDNIEWIKLMTTKHIKTSSEGIALDIMQKIQEDIKEYDFVFMLDCDKTLSLNDSTYDFFEHANFNPAFLKNVFKHDNYSLFQLNKVANQYSIMNNAHYHSICDRVANKNVILANETISYIKNNYSDFYTIGITSGIKDVWEKVRCNINFPDKIIGGSYMPNDRYVISDEVKRLVAKKIMESGKYVVSIGDSMIDIPMLKQSNEGYIVSYEKINKSVQREINEYGLNIPQWICSEVLYENINMMGDKDDDKRI